MTLTCARPRRRRRVHRPRHCSSFAIWRRPAVRPHLRARRRHAAEADGRPDDRVRARHHGPGGDERELVATFAGATGAHAAAGHRRSRRVAIALYPRLGFLITMSLLVFALLVVVERRKPLIAGDLRDRADAVRLLAVRHRAEGAARTRPALVLTAVEVLDSLLLGFSVALQPDVLLYALHRLPGRHAGRHAARHRPARRHQHPAAAHLRARRHQGDRDAGRHLLRLAIWRLDHLDPAAHSGRSRLGDDLHRRQRHGAGRAAPAPRSASPRSAPSSPAPSA